MKVVFCIDDNPRYLALLKVAVRSLRALHGTDVPCLCVYAGTRLEVLETVQAEGIPLAHYSPRLQHTMLPPAAQGCRGCFLKLELALLPELARDEYVLYCDVDVLFYRPLHRLFDAPSPSYMGMAREYTAPFWHEHEKLFYEWRGNRHTVPMPFPIWTFSSGVVFFNLARLRQRGLIEHFLAFAAQNVDKIGNWDQSLLNYFFGRRIQRLDDCWNCPPYLCSCLDTAHIVHFHGPKPWDNKSEWSRDLRINHFEYMRHAWLDYLDAHERAEAECWG